MQTGRTSVFPLGLATGLDPTRRLSLLVIPLRVASTAPARF